MELTIKQEAFCMAYAKCGNATEAYKQVGYKVKNDNAAAASSSALLRNPKVRARLEAIRKRIESERIMSPMEMQQRLTQIARQEVGAEGKPPPVHAALKAMDLLGKMQGSFITRQEVELSGAVNFGEIIEAARERIGDGKSEDV